jgi:hypothetical protein
MAQLHSVCPEVVRKIRPYFLIKEVTVLMFVAHFYKLINTITSRLASMVVRSINSVERPLHKLIVLNSRVWAT